MASGKKPDPRRKKNVAPHSTYLKVECGKKVGAYSAGEVFGCYSHRTFATLPCVANLTDDALKCPYCEASMEPTWRGWVPLWDSDWVLRHVLIGEEILESVDAIPHRAKVSVSRAKNPISPLIVREEVAVTRELPNTCPWRDPVDMLAVCLVLWNLPELTRWMETHRQAPPAPTPLPKGVALKSDGKPFSPSMQAAAKRYGGPLPEAADVVYDAAVNRLAKNAKNLKPSENGKH